MKEYSVSPKRKHYWNLTIRLNTGHLSGRSYVAPLISFQTFGGGDRYQNVIAIHLMRWQANFYDFRFKWTVTPGIGIPPIKAWLWQLLNFKNAIWSLEERYAIKFRFKLGKNCLAMKAGSTAMTQRPRKRIPEETSWLSQTQEGQTEQIHQQTFDDIFFWKHWHDLHALGSHWTDGQ